MERLIVSCILLLLLCCAVSAALANSWGLSGPLLTYVSAVHTWNDYSADTFFYKRNADTTAAVISSRYHSILMVSGPLDSGITHSSTTAVFQPADKSGHPTVTCTDQTVTVFYSKPACSFTFTREPGPRQDYYLTHAEKGGIVFDMSLEDNVCLVNQRLVWQTEPITLENFNIRLFPESEQAVRHLNLIYAYLNDASGFWHEPVFRNMQISLPVYSWTDAQSFRAAKGKAAVSLKDTVYVMATQDRWSLIEYEVSARTHRIGWIYDAPLAKTAPVFTTRVHASGTAWLTDDPLVSQYQIKQGSELNSIQLIARLNPFYAYASALTKDGQQIGGFVPLTSELLLPVEEPAPETGAKLAGVWTFVSGGEIASEILNLREDGSGLLTGSSGAIPCAWRTVKNAAFSGTGDMLIIEQENGCIERYNISGIGFVPETGRTELTLTCGESGGTWARTEAIP